MTNQIIINGIRIFIGYNHAICKHAKLNIYSVGIYFEKKLAQNSLWEPNVFSFKIQDIYMQLRKP